MANARARSGTISSQLTSQIQNHAAYFDGSVRLLTSVHPNSASDYPNVLLNRDRWPGIQAGDVIELVASHMKEPCVFIIDQNDPTGLPPNLQVCETDQQLVARRLTRPTRSLFHEMLQNVSVLLAVWKSL